MALPIREGDIPGIQLRARRRLAIDRAEAWRWLTERDRLERWLADRVEVDAGPRGGLRLERDTAAGPVVETGQDRADRSAARRGPSRFARRTSVGRRRPGSSCRCSMPSGGCDLDVLQTGFHLLAMSSCLTIWEEYRRRWRDALERLAEHG